MKEAWENYRHAAHDTFHKYSIHRIHCFLQRIHLHSNRRSLPSVRCPQNLHTGGVSAVDTNCNKQLTLANVISCFSVNLQLRTLHTESEMFACVFPFSLSFPIKMNATDAKMQKIEPWSKFFCDGRTVSEAWLSQTWGRIYFSTYENIGLSVETFSLHFI